MTSDSGLHLERLRWAAAVVAGAARRQQPRLLALPGGDVKGARGHARPLLGAAPRMVGREAVALLFSLRKTITKAMLGKSDVLIFLEFLRKTFQDMFVLCSHIFYRV